MTNLSVVSEGERVVGFDCINLNGSCQEGFFPLPKDFNNLKDVDQRWLEIEEQLKPQGVKIFHARGDQIFINIGEEKLHINYPSGAETFLDLMKDQQITINLETIFGEKA